MAEHTKLTDGQFSNGWKHFCQCIDFGRSNLDAEAIRFMNEMPARIIGVCKQRDGLLAASSNLTNWLRSTGRTNKPRANRVPAKLLEALEQAIANTKQ